MKTIKLNEKNTEVYNLLVKLNMPKSQIQAFIDKHTKKEKTNPIKKLLPEYKLIFITKCETCGSRKEELFVMINSVKYSLKNNKNQIEITLYDNLPTHKEYRKVSICSSCEQRLNFISQEEVIKQYLDYIKKSLITQRKQK